MIKRQIAPAIEADLKDKIVLLSGPRQCGKTTLSRMISKSTDYLSFDIPEDRVQILKKEWDRNQSLIVLDELHKMKNWKRFLKGVYDAEGLDPQILVTGSARMDIAKKMGDSLAGRHFQYHLFPFDLKELKGGATEQKEQFEYLLRFSGFPEPFLKGRTDFYHKWKRGHSDLILRQDLIDLEAVRDIPSIELLVELLKSRAGQPLSYASLARDLQKDIKTVQRWIKILENLFLLFPIFPYSKNIAQSVLKEPKIYFYDTAMPNGDEGLRVENLVALSLKKEVARLNEALGLESSLHTLRLKGGREVDFLILRKGLPAMLIEVKLSDDEPSERFKLFDKYFPGCQKIQLVKTLKREKGSPLGVEVRSLIPWLAAMDLEHV